MKKDWKRPELIVIARSNPEESVLNACKTAAAPAGALMQDSTCSEMGLGCSQCNGIDVS